VILSYPKGFLLNEYRR